MTKPVVLPSDFMNEWAFMGGSQDVGLKEGSRITASGFTDTTIKHQESVGKVTKPNVNVNLGWAAQQPKEAETIESLSKRINEMIASSDLRSGEPVVEKMETKWKEDVNNRYVTMADFTEFAKTIQNSIHPKDSASQVTRGMSSVGSELREVRRGSSSKLSGILEMESEIEGTVIGGFDLTPFEKIREVDSYVNIGPVRGLPRIFLNDRLNFLCHIHSALFKLVTDSEGHYPSVMCLEILIDSRKKWPVDPSTNLLESVLDSTIDLRTGEVKSNPFRIPILEPTMVLTPKIMHMALDQLHREFEVEWFNTLKTTTTPKFQSKYESHKYSRSGGRSSGSERRRNSSSSGRSSKRNSSVEGGSVISSLFGK